MLDRRDSSLELAGIARADRDEAGAAEHAVADGEVGFLLRTSWYSAACRASSIWPIFCRCAASEMYSVGPHRRVEQRERAPEP